MKPYEGMPAYEAGIKEGKEQAIAYFDKTYSSVVLKMLELISENSTEDVVIEMANDCYNYIKGNSFKKGMEINHG